ncbi:hypothetical protein D3C80_1551860 [compost metagenome]
MLGFWQQQQGFEPGAFQRLPAAPTDQYAIGDAGQVGAWLADRFGPRALSAGQHPQEDIVRQIIGHAAPPRPQPVGEPVA